MTIRGGATAATARIADRAVHGAGKASLSTVLLQCFRDALYPPIGRRVGFDDKEARLGRLHRPFIISIKRAPKKKKTGAR
jgi:hypothetical protein